MSQSELALKIAIVDDHQILLDGIGLLVSSMRKSYEVSLFSTPSEALKILDDGGDFDVVMTDLVMKDMNGLAFVSALRQRGKKMPILILSGVDNLPSMKEIFKIGANGFLHKNTDQAELSKALKTILNGDLYLPHDAPPIWAYEKPDTCGRSGTELSENSMPQFSARQIEVISLMGDGASNKEISNRLAISENTVKTHLRQIFAALQVANRTACVKKAQVLGLI